MCWIAFAVMALLRVSGVQADSADVPSAAGPSSGSRGSLRALRLTKALQIDGHLKEEAWQIAPAAGAFIQDSPNYGQLASAPTEVRVLYDDQYLYVGARMSSAPVGHRISPLVHRRDQNSASDWFGVAIDSVYDRRSAYEFRVNAAGVQRDVLLYADSSSNDQWDALWDSAVSTDDHGWTAELRIPISLLRIRDRVSEQTWGVNFIRINQHPEETTRWHVVARSENAFVSRFPSLVGLSGLKPQARRELVPYLTSRAKVATSQDFDDRGLEAQAGIDAHLGIGSSSLLDLTFLPDFGQTEVDEVILNLSTFETFLPEKRAFFLEGTEIFRVNGPQLFYSRRIGQSAPSASLGPDERLIEQPLAIEILGAAKFTGKYENGLAIGALVAQTEPAYARVRTSEGTTAIREIEPTSDNVVMRISQQLGGEGAYLGAFSSLHREHGDDGRMAYVGATDGTWKSCDSSAQIDALAAISAINQSDTDLGAYGTGSAVKRWGEGWYLAGNATYASRTFNPNDLGFLDRPDRRSIRLETGRQWDKTLGVFRNWGFYGSAAYATDRTNRAYNKNVDGRMSTSFTNSWSAYLGGGLSLPLYDDRELRTFRAAEKKYLHRDYEPYVTAGMSNARSSGWYVSLDLSAGQYEGGPTATASLQQTIRASSRLEFQLATDLVEARGELRWLETQGDVPVVGLRRLRQLSQVLRASYAFTPDLTIQGYAQLLLASWNYRDLKSYVDNDTLAPGAMSTSTAFAEHAWNVNLVMRWELRPGSTFYAVYTHGAFDDEVINRDATLSPSALSALWHAATDDVFQVKLSWLFR